MLGLSEEEVQARNREIAAQDERDRAFADENVRELHTSWARMKEIMSGQRPTRETNEEWRRRKAQEAAAASQPKGMLPTDPYALYRMRASMAPNDPRQAQLGPLEHGAFVEEAVRENPLMALPMAAAIPAYTLGKATGLISGTRSPASVDEMVEAYKGMIRGLRR